MFIVKSQGDFKKIFVFELCVIRVICGFYISNHGFIKNDKRNDNNSKD
jgi:uncharacterized membrane protein